MFRETRSISVPKILALVFCFVGLFVSAYSLPFVRSGYELGQRDAAPGMATDVVPFGVNVSLDGDDAPTQQRKLQLLRAAGFRWVRQSFPWREIEPAKRSFAWQKWDLLVERYRQYGLEVVAVLDQPPSWSRQDNNWPNRPPDDFEDFGRYVSSFVAHFQGKVRYVQIWDEPNIFPNWGNRPVDPAAYTELLKVANEYAKKADPTVKVLTAGLAPNLEKGGRNMSDLLFLSEMYRHGAGRYFDILATKPYGLWSPPFDPRVDDDVLNFSRVVRAREISVRNGYADKPVWAVEFGWNSLPDGWKGGPSIWGNVSEESQASYVRQAYQRASREWPWLQVLLLQGLLPQHDPLDPRYGFSIADPRLEPRPVYRAVEALAAAPTASAGWHSPDSPFVSYAGAWRDQGVVRGGSSGDNLEIRFVGTRLDLLLWKTPAGGIARVSVDGREVTNSPQLSGQGTLDLYAEQPHEVRVVAATGLVDGEHTLRLQLAGGVPDRSSEPQFLFAGFEVRRELGDPWVPLFGAAWLAWTGVFLLVSVRLSFQVGARLRRRLTRVWSENERITDLLVGGGIILALGLLYFAPGLPASLAALIGLVALVYCRIEIGLLFVIFVAPFYMRPKTFGGAEFSLAEILILVCVLVYALRLLFESKTRAGARLRLGSWHVNSPVFFFLLAGIISLTASTMLRESLRELRTVVIEPVIYYYMLVSALREKRRALDLANVLILAAVVVSVVGIYQYVFTSDVITAEGVRRIRGFYGSPNNLGLFLGRAIPLALSLAWLTDRHRKTYLLALLVLCSALFLSFSVGAWIAVALSALFIAVFAGRRMLAWSLFGGVAGGVALLPVLQVERVNSHVNLQESTTVLRLHIWQAALNMIRDNPIGGIGLDNFLYKYPDYMLPQAWREPNLSHPHNLLLDFWLRVGSPGLIVFLWLLFEFFSVSIGLYRRLGDGTSRALVLGLIASMVTFVLHGLVDNSYFLVDLAIIFWATLAAIRILDREGESA